MKKLIRIFIVFIGIIILSFSVSQQILAATVPYTITAGIPGYPPSRFGITFFETDLTVNFQSGKIIFSGQPNGLGNTFVDDAINMTVKGPDNITRTYIHYYNIGCRSLSDMPPVDITNYFKPGINQVRVKLFDVCGISVGSSSLYLANTNAPDPTPTPTPTPTPPAKIPVILIPGIGGSELKVNNTYLWSFPDGHGGTYNHTYPAGEKVWVNEDEAKALGNDDYFDILRMRSDGQTPEADLGLTGNLYAGAYQGTIDFLVSAGYTLNKDLFVFPYDWRKDISSTAPLLDQKIESIKTQTGSQKVDIVAHSMGGLVARNYIADPTKAGKVRKLITLGTPHLGAVDTLNKLFYGGCLTKPGVLTDLSKFNICFGLSQSEVKDVLQNMISSYELTPSQKYYEFYNGSDNNHPLPFVDNRNIDNNGITGFLNYTQIKTILTKLGYNTSLFTPSENFHNLDNNLSNTNGVDVSIIAGSGKATTGQIIEDYYLNFTGIKIPKTDIRKVNGDETVPLFSASLTDGTKSLIGSAKIYYTDQFHGNLVGNGPALNLTKNILNNDDNIPSGVSTTPYNFTGTGLSVHSPVLIHAYDQNGKHTGPLPNGDYEIKIPGSSYEVLGDAKFIWLPNNGVYTLKFEATDNGSFDFKIRDYENDINDKTILYKDIPLTQNTKAETVLDTSSQTPPVLQVDQDGNGTIDKQVNPTSNLNGNAVYDQTPPQTQIKLTGIIEENNWYKSDVLVELTPNDQANGSGILKTEYSLDNGQTIKIYNSSFTISSEGLTNIKFRSIDNAGNEENPQEVEIKVDKTTPIVNLSADPKELWPVNKKLVDVKISGNAIDNISGISSKVFSVSDKYNKLNPVISDFNQTIKLEAWREGNDKDGRIYEIKVIVKDLAGNQQTAITQILVPHDKREK